jgi:hypothetical protein
LLSLAASRAAGVLVGLSGATPPSLVHLDALTGRVVLTGAPLPGELVAQQLAALDAPRGLFYALGFDTAKQRTNLLTLNASSGALLARVLVPALFEPDLVGVGQALAVDARSGRLVAMGRRSAGSPHEVGLLDPQTGGFAPLVNLSRALGDDASCVAAVDANGARVLVGVADRGVEELALVELDAPHTVSPVPESFGDGRNLQALGFDAAARAFVGLGISPDTMHRTVVRLNETSLPASWSVAGAVSGFLVMLGSICAVDEAAGVIYWMGAKGETTSPFFIVGVSAADASVVSVSKAPVEAPEPWSLFWLPAGGS